MQAQKGKGESEFKYFIKNLLSASAAGCVAEIATIPIDTAKVRLQIQGKQQDKNVKSKYAGFYGTMRTIKGEEGFKALYKGLSAGLQRQIVFAGLRVGLYLPVRNVIAGDLKPGENPSLFIKIVSALITGTIGISIANPFDVVKVRL